MATALRFTARYGGVQPPHRANWETERGFGPLERLRQSWTFKAVPGGTEVTLAVDASVRFKFVATIVERLLRSASATSLIELQRQVDAQGAALVEELGREMARKQRDAQRALRPGLLGRFRRGK